MSEKRFTFGPVSPNFAMIKDNGEPMDTEEVVDLLNEQQSEINSLKMELELISGEKLFSRRELERKVDEQQATIEQLQDLCGESDGENAKLRIENEQLKNKLNKEYIKERSIK